MISARREDIESARAEIELIKLQNEIDELNKLRQTDPSNAALNPTNANMGTPTAITDPNTTSIETRLAEAAKKANDLVASLTPEPGKGPRARSSSLESSPEEHFEDLNAYRARIRQRLTEVGLDDVHDANGNALYRLQFTATVLPGAVKNKFGILDLEIASAEARADQVSRLYQDWLVSLMRRGVEEQSAGNPVEWERLQTVMLQNELMDYVPLEHPVYTQKGLNDLILFTYPGHQDIVREAINNPCIAEALEASAMSRELGDKCAKNDSGETITYDPGALSKNLIETFPSLSAIEVFLSSYRSELLRDGGAGEIELSHDLRALAAQLSKAATGREIFANKAPQPLWIRHHKLLGSRHLAAGRNRSPSSSEFIRRYRSLAQRHGMPLAGATLYLSGPADRAGPAIVDAG